MSDSTSPPATDAATLAASVPATAAPAPTPDDDDIIDLTPRIPDDYNPADYRWVPVRRRPRHDGWTEEKQRRFIEVLADTGQVALAAREVGMTRETAYRLRRSAHGAAFARAWDAARHHAGSLLEDVAFERAIEGVERNVYDGNGEVVATRHVYNDRLLTFLLSALKPERYAQRAPSRLTAARVDTASSDAVPEATVEACLRALEPPLPAPVDALLDTDTLADELQLADVADGVLPHFLMEKRAEKSPERIKAEAIDAQHARGKAACERMNSDQAQLTKEEFRDMCHYLDPTYRAELGRQRFR